MVCYVKPSGCESWRIMLSKLVVNHGKFHCASGCESWCVIMSQLLWNMLCQWVWFMVCYDEPVVVNHGVYCWASDCESWWVSLRQLLWIMVCYNELVVVHYAVLFLWIMVSYTEPVGVSHGELCCAKSVNHGVLCWASGCDSCFAMLVRMVVSDGV